MSQGIIVLKLGGSVLAGEGSIHAAVAEVRRWVASGLRVIAVVSAFEGETDRLLETAARFGREPWATASFAATGELTSAAALSLALSREGLTSTTLDAAGIGLLTSENPLDAEPLALNEEALREALREYRAVVLPGFIGRDAHGRTTLLGRGGSDLSAIFVAGRLGARCRLVKDVPGLFDQDPKSSDGARLHATLHWDDALRLDGRILQEKGVRLAKRLGLEFEVAQIGAWFATRVGDLAAAAVAEQEVRS